MENQGSWSSDANNALHITLVQSGKQKPETVYSFRPTFTYPIFGDEERIFGYKGLIIRLRFTAHDLKPHVHISYDEKFTAVDDANPLDLIKTLKEWLPEAAFAPLPQYEASIQEDDAAKDFTPPGKLVHSYSTKDRNYEIWAGSLSDPAVATLLDRMQIFTSLYIEAGTPISTEDPEWTLERWTVFFVYEKVTPSIPTASPYSLVGYCTAYRWYYFNKDLPNKGKVSNESFPFSYLPVSQVPSRLRIAQFLILPPHQTSGHGTHLYTTIHRECLADPTISELTVEDPNEAFDALRDTIDWHLLRPVFDEHKININPDPYPSDMDRRRSRYVPTSRLIPTVTLKEIRAKCKIAEGQFVHVLEMYLLNQIPIKHRAAGGATLARILVKKSQASDINDRRYYWWRMLVKQRLYKKHKDILIQLDHSERVEKLDQTLHNVEEGHDSLLKALNEREEAMAELEQEQEQEEEEELEPAKERTKRKFTVEDEEDEEDIDTQGESAAAKRPKV